MGLAQYKAGKLEPETSRLDKKLSGGLAASTLVLSVDPT